MYSTPNHNLVSLPAQHGVGMSCEDGGIHHKSCVVHNERDSFSQSQPRSMLFAAQVVHVDHIAGSLTHSVAVLSRRT